MIHYSPSLNQFGEAGMADDVVAVEFEDYQNILGYEFEPGPGGQPRITLAGLRAKLWVAIKAERDRRQGGGVKLGASWFHSDPLSRIQQIGLVMLGANIPAGLLWKTMSGAMVPMNQTVAGQLFAAAAAAEMALFAHGEALRAAINAAADPLTIDTTTGWPQVYADTLETP